MSTKFNKWSTSVIVAIVLSGLPIQTALAQAEPDPTFAAGTDSPKKNAPMGHNPNSPFARPPIAPAFDGLLPFGAKLFTGKFAATRGLGINPDYKIMPGDRVAIYVWGASEKHDVFVVDLQGNIFLPEIGPVHLAGVKNSDLTQTVKKAVNRIYRSNVSVYTNLVSPNPVSIFVTGGVNQPGRYAGIPSDSVLFFIDQAGGIDSNMGSYRNIVLLRDGQEIAHVDLYDFLLTGVIDIPQLQDNDTILVTQRGPIISIKGDVATPCALELKKGDNKGQDILKIIPSAATATAVTLTGIRNNQPFNRTMTLASFSSQEVKNGDKITVRDDGRADTIFVKLAGEFDGPSMLTVKRGTRLLDLLNYVPIDGFLAETSAVHLLRHSVAKAQKDSINDALFRLERSALLALSNSRGEAEIRVKEAELTAKFVERARQIQPLGRVVTVQGHKQLNVILEDGDTIVIPKKTNVVRIGGEVMISQAVIHQDGATARDYIAMAGGYSERADDDQVIVLHADASVTVEKPSVRVDPGDEILVPPRIDVKVLQNATDVMQIIYQVAMSAGVVLAL